MGKIHWADVIVKKVIAEKGNKDNYTVAAGITPSGTVHIGNFREIITVDLIARAFRDAGKKIRFIYSWDDYDVFRKVPKNMPKQDMLKKNLRKSIVDVPDPFGKDESYARHFEIEVENDVAKVGVNPEYLFQAKKYRNGEYIKGIKTALDNTKKIREILNKHRQEPLAEDWLPLTGFCPKCMTDNIKFSNYSEDNVDIKCDCGFEDKIDINQVNYLKLPWRIDWPMRWAFEKVDFEPGGKDHSTTGGSFDTGKEIVEIYNWSAPSYLMYNFISIKGAGGKISSSAGNVITLGDCLEIYEPEIVRWLFAGTRAGAEFAISFDVDVLKIYEDFDKCERVYFGEQEAKDSDYQKRIYELSMVDKVPKKMPFQPSFRHLTNVLQLYNLDIEKTIQDYSDELKNENDKTKLKKRAICAKNWIEKYAPEEFKFTLVDKVSIKLKNNERDAISAVISKVGIDTNELHQAIYDIAKSESIEPKDFFALFYNALIGKEKGPRLASFLTTIGKTRLEKMFSEVL